MQFVCIVNTFFMALMATYTAIVRNSEKVQLQRNLEARKADVYQADDLSRVPPGHDVIISAFSPDKNDPDIRQKHVQGLKSLVEAMKRIGLKRLLVVGGAGSLEVKPGLRVIDTLEFPEQWKGTARATADVLQLLRCDQELEWTFLSPAAMLQPGIRTGTFRPIRNDLPFDIVYRLVRPDGSVRWAQSIGTPVTNGNGTVVEIVGTLCDISDSEVGAESVDRK